MDIKIEPQYIVWKKDNKNIDDSRKISTFIDAYKDLPDFYKEPLSIPLGMNSKGTYFYTDLEKAPHLLITGLSGGGKSVYLNNVITTLISRVSPKDLKLVLIDTKRIEMNRYKDIPHLYFPLIGDPIEANRVLNNLEKVMNERYQAFEEANYSTSINEYNAWAKDNNKETLPYIIVVVDEYADLLYSCKEVATPLLSLLMKARASGIHVIVSTQIPSDEVITPKIRDNMPTRVCFVSANEEDSIAILGVKGAEELLHSGEMLAKAPSTDKKILRLQAPFISGNEIKEIVNEIKSKYQEIDEVYNKVKSWVLGQEYVTTSKIQRECAIGFNRATNYIKKLQEDKIINLESDKNGYRVL